MKARGKSDARVREMIALHLPRGTGPADRQDVRTICQADVKKIKAEYQNDVLEPQRTILKNLYSMRETRRIVTSSKQKLYSVALEPYVRQKAQEKVAQDLALGGLSLGLNKKKAEPDKDSKVDPAEAPEKFEEPEPVEEAPQQMSFSQLSKITGMEVRLLEDVFRKWMNHADKTEMINKKHFTKLLEDLCPQRNFSDNDMDAWWDQVHELGQAAHSANPSVDWQASDPDIRGESRDSEDDKKAANAKAINAKHLQDTRRSPATFDQFIQWWASSEVRKV
jgi:hypothetical protein